MRRNPISVLLIEDNPGDVRLIEEMLADSPHASFEVESHDRLQSAAKRAAEEPFDVLLLDLGLPESQGLETLRRTRESDIDLPIVVLTGLEDEAVGLEALRQGAQDYLVKGQAGGHELARCLAFSIERKRLLDHLRVEADILRFINRSSLDAAKLEEAIARVRDHLDVQAVGLRLPQDDNWPFVVALGYDEAFLDEAQGLRPPPPENAQIPGNEYVCFCGAVLAGELSVPEPWTVEDGALFCDRLSEMSDDTGSTDWPEMTRECCRNAGFESLALVPLRTEDTTVGMIHAADPRPEAFDEQDVSLLHNVGESIAIALCRQRAEDALSVRDRMLHREPETEHSIVSSGSIKEAANIAAATLCNLLQCDRASVAEFDLDAGKVCIRGAHGVSEEGAGPAGSEFSMEWFPAIEELQNGKSREVGELRDMSDLAPMETAWLEAGIHSCMIIPLTVDSQLLGALNIGWLKPGEPNHAFKTTAFRFADMLSAVLLNFRIRTRLQRAESTLETAQHEMSVARAIQQKLYPREAPSLDGFDVGGTASPAQTAGGDYFDYVRLPDDSLYIAVGDAVGHSTGAALVMASTRAYLRSFAEVSPEMDYVLGRVNKQLAEEVTSDLFCTLALLQLKAGSSSVSWLNAGHPAVCILDADGRLRASLDSNAFPLGVLPDADIPAPEEHSVEPGEMMVLFTDGVLEARSEDGEVFGRDKALDVVRSVRKHSAQKIAEAVHDAVEDFCRPERPDDDVTCVVVKRETER